MQIYFTCSCLASCFSPSLRQYDLMSMNCCIVFFSFLMMLYLKRLKISERCALEKKDLVLKEVNFIELYLDLCAKAATSRKVMVPVESPSMEISLKMKTLN